MNCRSAKANFSSYIEQELSEIERRGVAAHLGRCPTCSSDLFAMQKAMSLLRWVPRVEGSPDFTRRLLERIRSEESREPAMAGWFGPLIEDWRGKCREFAAMLAAPAPVGALLAALVVGGGGGAILMQAVNAPVPLPVAPASLVTPGTSSLVQAETEQTQSAQPPLGPAPPATSGMATAQAAAGGPMVASAEAATVTKPSPRRERPPVRSPRPATPASPKEGVEVAEWANGGQRLEGLPEGPPPISRVEYVLDRVDLNGRPIQSAPASLQVQEGSVTF